MELTHCWTLQPPLADYRDIHRSVAVCFWCGSSPNEEYAGNSLLQRDERTGGPTATEGWNPAVPRSTAEYATGADTRPGMAFIAAVRRPVISKACHPDPGRLETQGLGIRVRSPLAGAWTIRVTATIPRVEISSRCWTEQREDISYKLRCHTGWRWWPCHSEQPFSGCYCRSIISNIRIIQRST